MLHLRPRPGADRCPGVLRPHEAADGLLVRVRLVGGRLDAHALRALAAAARATGARLALTARANVQLRGLRTTDLDPLARGLAAGGLLPPPSHDRVRHVLADPLVGRRPQSRMTATEADATLDGLAAAIVADDVLAGLSGRFLFAVDDESGALAGAGADAVVRAATDEAIIAAVVVARRVARAPGAWRAADVDGRDGRPERLRGDVAGAPVGRIRQSDGRLAVGAIAPLGQIGAAALDALADVARDVRVSRDRGLVAVDLPDERAAERVEATLRDGGLVLAPDSGWRGLTACAGSGACARALADVRTIAVRRAAERRADGTPFPRREHWSACSRRCGETPDVEVGMSARCDGGWDRREARA